jgi:hypothetical protein
MAALVVFELAMLTSAVRGRHFLWPLEEPRNLSEAIALRDGLGAIRRLEAGSDPNERGLVRAGWLDSAARWVSPLEAAAFNRRPELIGLLLAHGATLDPASWLHLRCAAANKGFGDVVETLDRAKPANAPTGCKASVTFW